MSNRNNVKVDTFDGPYVRDGGRLSHALRSAWSSSHGRWCPTRYTVTLPHTKVNHHFQNTAPNVQYWQTFHALATVTCEERFRVTRSTSTEGHHDLASPISATQRERRQPLQRRFPSPTTFSLAFAEFRGWSSRTNRGPHRHNPPCCDLCTVAEQAALCNFTTSSRPSVAIR
jgi:hypothetical protein